MPIPPLPSQSPPPPSLFRPSVGRRVRCGECLRHCLFPSSAAQCLWAASARFGHCVLSPVGHRQHFRGHGSARLSHQLLSAGPALPRPWHRLTNGTFKQFISQSRRCRRRFSADAPLVPTRRIGQIRPPKTSLSIGRHWPFRHCHLSDQCYFIWHRRLHTNARSSQIALPHRFLSFQKFAFFASARRWHSLLIMCSKLRCFVR